ncbi:MAG TPA: ABC transporter permease [Bacteroidales bacterium]|nr:ABC transporter permease [Bacteroidales bacterium]
MKTLFRIEFTKTLNYNPFRIILILHLLFFLLGLFALPRIDIKFPFLSIVPLYQFPHVWNFTTWIAGYYNITLVLLVIMMTSLEFSNKTYKQQVIFGMSRKELFMEKLILIFYLSVYVAALLFITSIASGLIFSYKITFAIIFERSWLILNSFLQTFAFLSMGILFALIFRNMILSVLVFGFYRVFLEPIVRSLTAHDYRWFFPTKFISSLTPRPDIIELVQQKLQDADKASPDELSNFNKIIPEGVPIWQNIILTLVFLGIILSVSAYIFRKRRLN